MVFEIVGAASEWLTARALARRMGAHRPADVTVGRLVELLDRLVAATVLQRSDLAPSPSDAAMRKWRDWNPAAGFFHGATKDLLFVEDDGLPWSPHEDTRTGPTLSTAGGGRDEIPSHIELVAPDSHGPLLRVLRQRRTWRRFSSGALSERQVSTLLWWTAGVQAWLHTPQGERVALKSSPSAGARHPINVYVLARNVAGVAPGFYAYDGERHRLRGIKGQRPGDVRQFLPRQHWYERSAVVLFFCAEFGRTMSRYRFPRAYRAIAAEAGHLCQTFCLVATAMGIAPFSTMALAEDAIDRELGLDGITESVLYAAGAGCPAPSGIASAPPGMTGVRIRQRNAPHRRPKA